MPIRDRIVELRRVPAAELRANPKNWRRHPETQARALRSVLEQVGYAGALLARETAEGLELIDGHLRASGPVLSAFGSLDRQNQNPASSSADSTTRTRCQPTTDSPHCRTRSQRIHEPGRCPPLGDLEANRQGGAELG